MKFPKNKQTSCQKNIDNSKQLGQVFTPIEITQFMVKWVVEKFQAGRILDPALGVGAFFLQFLSKEINPSPFQLEGYEIDSELVEKVTEIFSSSPLNLTVQNKDFLLTDISQQYDGILSNPPYIHFQDYSHSLSLIKKFNQQYNLNLTGFSNIYALFLIKALHLLKNGGRASFIIPSEFLNADYGKSIKKMILDHHSLKYLIIFSPKFQVFKGFLTTSAILLFDNSNINQIKMTTVENFSELKQVEASIYDSKKSSAALWKDYSTNELNPDLKWKYYYQDMKFNFQKIKGPNYVSFSTFINLRRGIATGANKFFTLSKKEAKFHKINSKYLQPCITKASQIDKNIFNQEMLNKLITKDKKVLLLTLNGKEIDENIKKYISHGEKLKYHTRYLTSIRTRWYDMEPGSSADILVKTFGRDKVMFIQNLTNALNLTCFHGIYLNSIGKKYQNILFLYLITELSREIFEGQKRIYGAGLGKFEPNDIKNTKIIDLRLISAKDLSILNLLYQEYKLNIYHQDKIGEIIDQVENIFYLYS